MSRNDEVLAKLVQPVTREVDLGHYSEQLKGESLTINLNVPHVVEIMREREGQFDFDTARGVVAALLETTPERLAKLGDELVIWIYNEGLEMYTEYHKSYRKNLNGGSEPAPTSTPSESR